MLNLKSFEDFLNESINKKIKIENQDKFYNFLIGENYYDQRRHFAESK